MFIVILSFESIRSHLLMWRMSESCVNLKINIELWRIVLLFNIDTLILFILDSTLTVKLRVSYVKWHLALVCVCVCDYTNKLNRHHHEQKCNCENHTRNSWFCLFFKWAVESAALPSPSQQRMAYVSSISGFNQTQGKSFWPIELPNGCCQSCTTDKI